MADNLYTFDQVVFLILQGVLFGMVSMMLLFRLIVAPRLRALSEVVESLGSHGYTRPDKG